MESNDVILEEFDDNQSSAKGFSTQSVSENDKSQNSIDSSCNVTDLKKDIDQINEEFRELGMIDLDQKDGGRLQFGCNNMQNESAESSFKYKTTRFNSSFSIKNIDERLNMVKETGGLTSEKPKKLDSAQLASRLNLSLVE